MHNGIQGYTEDIQRYAKPYKDMERTCKDLKAMQGYEYTY